MTTMREYRVIHRHADDIDHDGTLLPDSKLTAQVDLITSNDMTGAENQILLHHPDHIVLEIELTRPSIPADSDTLNQILDNFIADGNYVLDQTEVDNFEGYDDIIDFIYAVNMMTDALREHDKVDQIDIDFSCPPGEPIDYAILTRSGWGNSVNRSSGFELEELTNDSSATGRDAYLNILQALVREYNVLR